MRHALVLALLTACAPDPGAGKPKAVVQDPPAEPLRPAAPETPAATDAGPIESLTVDTARSKIEALGAKITATHPIVFHQYNGKVALSGDTVSAVSFEVQMDSLESDDPKLTKHLKNEDFFDVPKFPTSTFTSASITAGAQEPGATHTVTGDFTIHGVTKRIAFPATISVQGKEVTARAEFVINRKDFGVVYPGRPDDLVQDNVRMTIQLVAAASRGAQIGRGHV